MKRKWFQVHLSTAVVLMFVSGGLLWLNMMTFRGGRILTDGSLLPGRYMISLDTLYGLNVVGSHGWPFRFHLEIAGHFENGRWWPWSILFNALVALVVLVMAATVSELYISRRVPQKS